MRLVSRRTVAAVAAGVVLATGSAVALAGGGGGGPHGSGNQTALLNDVASRLDVTGARLRTAIKNAFKAQIDQQLKDGLLTEAQAAAAKERIDAGRVGVSAGNSVRFSWSDLGYLQASATYLDLTVAQLRTQLAAGKSLSDLAGEKSKSASGLQDAIVARATSVLAAAVAAGDLTDTQRDSILTQVKNSVDELVQRTFGGLSHGGRGKGPR